MVLNTNTGKRKKELETLLKIVKPYIYLFYV